METGRKKSNRGLRLQDFWKGGEGRGLIWVADIQTNQQKEGTWLKRGKGSVEAEEGLLQGSEASRALEKTENKRNKKQQSFCHVRTSVKQ